MDNSANKSILETINESINNNANPSAVDNSLTSTSSNEDGWFSSLFSVPISTWIIIFLILTFLGFNLFVYLAKGTQDINSFFTSITSNILEFFGMLTGKVADTSTGLVNAGSTGLQSVSQSAEGNKASSSVGGTPIPNSIPQPDIMQNNTLNKALNNSNVQQNIGQSDDYEADDSTSSIQKSQTKGGYCYIGEERGYRSCMPVNENDTCMSGEIFPTQEICINPSLRV
jgi:hypothetical protein